MNSLQKLFRISTICFVTANMLRVSALGAPPVTPPAKTAKIAAPAPYCGFTSWPTNDAGLKELATTLINGWFGKIAVNDYGTGGVLDALQPNFQLLNFQGASDAATSKPRIMGLGTPSPTVSNVVATRVGDALVATCLVKSEQSIDGNAMASEAMPQLGVFQVVDGQWKMAAWASLNAPKTRQAPTAPTFAGDTTLNTEGAAMLGKFLMAQHKKDLTAFDAMLATGMQAVNCKGQKVRDDIMQGAKRATSTEPVMTDIRATRCGDLRIVTCNLAMGQTVGFTTLPADPAPFMAVLQGSGDTAKVIAVANTNKPNKM